MTQAAPKLPPRIAARLTPFELLTEEVWVGGGDGDVTEEVWVDEDDRDDVAVTICPAGGPGVAWGEFEFMQLSFAEGGKVNSWLTAPLIGPRASPTASNTCSPEATFTTQSTDVVSPAGIVSGND